MWILDAVALRRPDYRRAGVSPFDFQERAMTTMILPPTLEKQTPAQMVAFAKRHEKKSPSFWRAVAQAASDRGDAKNEAAAKAICVKLEKHS